ncbi:hypothetical protein AAFC00_002123 [Neodothiora populina]
MSNHQRYASQPPSHRGYDDDPHNEYDDAEPWGPGGRYRGNDHYEPVAYQQQNYFDQPRYPNDRVPQHYDALPPASTQEQAAPYVAAGTTAGALAPYPRRRDDYYPDYDNEDRRVHRSSRSHRRRDSRSSSRSRSRSRSRSGAERRFRDVPSLAFDKSELGIGVGIAGALVGGLLGREMGDHKKRGTALGAVIGGIGANIAEHRWKIYKEEKRAKEQAMEDAWYQRHPEERASAYAYDDRSSRRRGHSR